MKKIFFKPLNRLVETDDRLIEIKLESPLIFRELTFEAFDNIIVSEDNEEIDMNKFGHVIYNPYDLSLAEKKLVNALYSIITKQINNYFSDDFSKIEQSIIKIIDDVFFGISIPFEFDNEIDVSKLLASIGVRYPTLEKNQYVEQLFLYLKIYTEVCRVKCFVSINLINMLTIEERTLLDEKLKELDVILIDYYVMNDTNHKNTLIVDSEWCSI